MQARRPRGAGAGAKGVVVPLRTQGPVQLHPGALRGPPVAARARRRKEQQREDELDGARAEAADEAGPDPREARGGAREGAEEEDGHERGEEDGGAAGGRPVEVGEGGQGEEHVVPLQPVPEAPRGAPGVGVGGVPPHGTALQDHVRRPRDHEREPHLMTGQGTAEGDGRAVGRCGGRGGHGRRCIGWSGRYRGGGVGTRPRYLRGGAISPGDNIATLDTPKAPSKACVSHNVCQFSTKFFFRLSVSICSLRAHMPDADIALVVHAVGHQ